MNAKKNTPLAPKSGDFQGHEKTSYDTNSIAGFAPGFNDQVAKSIITNLYQIYFRERGIEGVEINVYNKDGELII